MPHDCIESVRVTGGYLKGLSIALAPGLNCVIGGTGAGKTTLLELVLFGLGVDPTHGRPKERDGLLAHALGAGEVHVDVRTRDGARFSFSRAYGEAARVTGEGGAPAILDRETFAVDYRATKEIEALASDPRAQLELLDRFVEAELRPLRAEIDGLVTALAENAARLAKVDGELAGDEERAGEVLAIHAALDALVTSGRAGADRVDPEVTKRANEAKLRRVREKDALDAELERVDARRLEIERLSRAHHADPAGRGVDVASLESEDLFARVRADLASIHARYGAALDALAASAASARAVLSSAAAELAARHAVADDALRGLLAEASLHEGAILERKRLERRLEDATKIARRQEARRRTREGLVTERRELRASLARKREQRAALRERAVRDVNAGLDGRVRVSRQAGADRTRYEALLGALTAGANIRPASFVAAVARELRPEDLAACIVDDDVEPLVAIDQAKTKREERARHLLETLRASGRAHELETVDVDDLALLELKVEGEFAPTHRLSTGERCTAVLTVVLQNRRGPLVIDEPEQHLHNRFIYSVLVELLERAQGSGQLLFATHNANIVVLGEAKRVFALEAGGGRAWVAEQGTVEELESAIVILEGGREALRRRTRRYRAEPTP